MIEDLRKILPATRIRTRYIDRVSFAADAGFYYLLPKAVVHPLNEAEIISLFHLSRQHRVPLVFRAGGTSLSGQAITDGILVDLSMYWNRIQVENDGATVRVQPGITGGMVNRHLKKYARKIGPDPSSINSAMMGGILSNNSSGMCCGVKLNSYHTIKEIRFVLPDGQIFSTEAREDYTRFEQHCAGLFSELKLIRRQILDDGILYDKIRRKYKTKNTVGYSLNAFVDFEHPMDILAHLLIGAEGTLAFISEAVLHSVPDYPHKATALLYFPDIYAACQAIVPLTSAGAMMVELMDRASLRAVQDLEGMPSIVRTLPETAAALLIEFQEETLDLLDARVNAFLVSSANLSLMNAPVFTSDPAEQDFLWRVRKGLFPAVGAVRASGTTVILEDIAFPVEKLGDAILDLQALFRKYSYPNAIIFGHAKDGNIHFVVTQSFHTDDEVVRYDRFIKEVVEMVVKKYDGTLKAEHGTGRNMAPFVETEWGGEAYRIINRIKKAVDPEGLLNPGVIVNDDANAHLKNLKALPSVEEEVDRCIECGYCEHRCPSRDLTTTPRRRIVVRRVLKDLERRGDRANYKLLMQQYKYDGMDTCAVDGLCASACPVDINTGDLIKRLRYESHSPSANTLAIIAAKNFAVLQWLARFGVKTGVVVNAIFGSRAMRCLTGGFKRIIPSAPLWSEYVASPPDLTVLNDHKNDSVADGHIVYFPSCISRMMGSYPGKDSDVMQTFMSICKKSNVAVNVLRDANALCCSQVFSSKGYRSASQWMANRVVTHLWENTNHGALPVVIDVSSCAYTLLKVRPVLDDINKKKFDSLKIMDVVDFLHDMVVPVHPKVAREKNIVLHPVCALEKMKTEQKFLRVAAHFARYVTIPKSAGCCGMAGDRGFLFPELTQSATQSEAREVSQEKYDGYYSSTKTCEIAMSEAVKQNYESILYLVDEAI
ncbi:MAG TPA: FAD-binding and (Fe-S)-binding domain-containing protein [Chryseosolibacter sp.]|nr:FAD-binding and (Fe-S)-binding domain-containing protein [Chryseosolibacter sp.]